jgi:hypothetical protein
MNSTRRGPRNQDQQLRRTVPWLAAAMLSVWLPGLPAAADPLSESDRQLLLERLEKLQAAAEGRASSRIGVAVSAFRNAVGSEAAALALYLKCIEKEDFEEQRRRSQEFREWKRRQDERLGDPGFALALRHQLNWLVLTLEATEKPERIRELAPRAASALEAIFLDAKKLEGQQGVLRQSVLGSAFARAYDVSGMNAGDWPDQPLALSQIFEKVLLPPLRQPSKIPELRDAWLRRIQYEAMLREGWGGETEARPGLGGGPGNGGARIGLKSALRPPDYERFLAEELPDLRWQMEEDLYKSGDQRGAALRMLDHLDKYLSHSKAETWTARFVKLLSARPELAAPPPEPPTNPDGTPIEPEPGTNPDGTPVESTPPAAPRPARVTPAP